MNVCRWFVVVVLLKIYFSILKFDVILMDTIRPIHMNLLALIYVQSMFQLLYGNGKLLENWQLK